MFGQVPGNSGDNLPRMSANKHALRELVFISYRHGPTEDFALRIYEKLAVEFGPAGVFLDIKNITGGKFWEPLKEALDRSDVFIAVIGEDWLGARRPGEEDWVRKEVDEAIKGNLTIIPVPVRRADMPKKRDIPEIEDLLRWTDVHIPSLVDFEYFMEKIFKIVQEARKLGHEVRTTRPRARTTGRTFRGSGLLRWIFLGGGALSTIVALASLGSMLARRVDRTHLVEVVRQPDTSLPETLKASTTGPNPPEKTAKKREGHRSLNSSTGKSKAEHVEQRQKGTDKTRGDVGTAEVTARSGIRSSDARSDATNAAVVGAAATAPATGTASMPVAAATPPRATNPPVPEPAVTTNDPALTVSRDHMSLGVKAYALGKYDVAIHEFEDAYLARKDPALLYNLALSHRAAGHPEQALTLYDSYLRYVPRAPNRPQIEARMRELELLTRK